MTYDVAALRTAFPSLNSGIAHFDSPGGTQTPLAVANAITAALTGPLSNRGKLTASERNADRFVIAFRDAFADLLGYPAAGISYGRSATSLIFDLARTLSSDWQPGDQIVLTRLDHDANVQPWLLAAAARDVEVRWIDFDPATGELVEPEFTDQTRLVALPGASNLIGTIPPIARIAAAAHQAGALVHVDGVHYAAHRFVTELGADFFTCSPYKFLGPHCGVQAADPALLQNLHPAKLRPATEQLPERFELGTLPYETMAGATAAVDFLAGLGSGQDRRTRLADAWQRIDNHEEALRHQIEETISQWPEVRLHSLAADRTPTLFFTFDGHDVHAAAQYLADRDVLAPAGTFYAWEPARWLGVEAGLRVGLAPYTDETDVARLLEGLAGFLGR